jgi:Tfp pilus assembly pilus retraction ATPase PilT
MGLFDFLKPPPSPATLSGLLALTGRMKGTELRLAPGSVPQAMVDGRLRPLSGRPLEPEVAGRMCRSLFTDKDAAMFGKNGEVEIAFAVTGLGRCRARIVSADGKVSGVIELLAPPRA